MLDGVHWWSVRLFGLITVSGCRISCVCEGFTRGGLCGMCRSVAVVSVWSKGVFQMHGYRGQVSLHNGSNVL